MTINDNFLIIKLFNDKDSNFTLVNDSLIFKINVYERCEFSSRKQGSNPEHGYLMAYDKKEQKAKGVKGIAANGELETLEANEANRDQFIKVDQRGNFFTNFGKNFSLPVQ